MAASAYADPRAFYGISLPKVWQPTLRRSLFGDVILVAFLLAQCFDGVFTYVGVQTHGLMIEANPLIAMMMMSLGHGAALAGAKGMAAILGICLHLRRVHGAVACLTLFYMVVAILPWMAILFL